MRLSARYLHTSKPFASLSALIIVAAVSLSAGPSQQGAPAITASFVRPATTQPSGLGLAGYSVKPAYEKAVALFEAVPTTRPTVIGGTVFIGSSSFTKWKSLEKDMAAFNAVNCGFGGSRTDDVLYYASRILKPLQPTRIVYYCGGNDVSARRAPDVVIENFKAFVALARKDFPNIPVYFISQNIVPTRAKFAAECTRVNQVVAQWASTMSGVFFINGQPGLLDAAGKPIVDLYVKDGIHLNRDGYKIWQANIEAGLKQSTAHAAAN